MKIAFITLMGGSQWGGSEDLWQKTAIFAKKNGHSVICSVYKFECVHSKIQELIDLNIEINYRNLFKNNASLFYKIRIYFKNRISGLNKNYKWLLDFNPDLILINQGGSFDIIVHHQDLRNILQKISKPYFLLCHNNTDSGSVPTPKEIEIANQIYKSAKKVFFVSEKNRNSARRQICDKIENSKIVKNPLNVKEKNIQKWNDDKISHFAMVGILNPNHKGQDILFEILSSNKWKNRNWNLNIYGKGDWKHHLQNLTKYFGIENKVIFHDYVSDINLVWQKNHILLMPSLAEGLPNTLCEAMICGRAAIVTDVGGNTEMITEGETGFVAEAPTVNSFSKALERAWENRDKWEELGKNAHEFAKKTIDFSPEKTLLDLLIS